MFARVPLQHDAFDSAAAQKLTEQHSRGSATDDDHLGFRGCPIHRAASYLPLAGRGEKFFSKFIRNALCFQCKRWQMRCGYHTDAEREASLQKEKLPLIDFFKLKMPVILKPTVLPPS